MATTEQKIEVMLGFVEGRTIQRKDRDCPDGRWNTLSTEPTWDWLSYEFRVKPEARVIWVNEYESEPDVVHDSKELAEEDAAPYCIRVAVKYREVIGEE